MNPEVQAAEFEAHDFHDSMVEEVRILPATEIGGSSSVEVLFKDQFAEPAEHSLLTIEGCTNISFEVDLDVLAENLFMNVYGLSAVVDVSQIRAMIADQISSWNVRYASDPHPALKGLAPGRLVTEAESPLPEKLDNLQSLTMFVIKLFGGHLSVIARSFRVNRLTAQCTRTSPLTRRRR